MGNSWEVEVREVNSLSGKCWKMARSTIAPPLPHLSPHVFLPTLPAQGHQTHSISCKSYANLLPPISPAAPRGVGNILVWVLPFINFRAVVHYSWIIKSELLIQHLIFKCSEEERTVSHRILFDKTLQFSDELFFSPSRCSGPLASKWGPENFVY